MEKQKELCKRIQKRYEFSNQPIDEYKGRIHFATKAKEEVEVLVLKKTDLMRITGEYNTEIHNIFRCLRERHEQIKGELNNVSDKLRKRNKRMTKMFTAKEIKKVHENISLSEDEKYEGSLFVDSFGSEEASSAVQSPDDRKENELFKKVFVGNIGKRRGGIVKSSTKINAVLRIARKGQQNIRIKQNHGIQKSITLTDGIKTKVPSLLLDHSYSYNPNQGRRINKTVEEKNSNKKLEDENPSVPIQEPEFSAPPDASGFLSSILQIKHEVNQIYIYICLAIYMFLLLLKII